MNKKIVLIAFLALIIISVIGLSAYLFQGTGKQQKELTQGLPEVSKKISSSTEPTVPTVPPLPEKEPTAVSSTPTSPQVPEIDTSDWKVYHNEKYGFEIKYPKDWQQREGEELKVGPKSETEKSVTFYFIPNAKALADADEGIVAYIVYREFKGPFIDDYIAGSLAQFQDSDRLPPPKWSEFESSGFEGIREEFKEEFKDVVEILAFRKFPGLLFETSVSIIASFSDKKAYYEETFKEMLSTFRLTK
jgi:hypothetical protein